MSDLYNVLGLEKNASETDIKKAYRKLAHQWHPDRNSNKEAESRFKEISQAYATLSDPVRRRDYDRGVARAPARSQGPNSDTGFGDLFQDIFSTFRRPTPTPQAQDAETKAEISFTESLQGTELSVTVTTPLACPRCQATGSKSQSRPLICPSCQGRGRVGDQFFGEVCPSCKGEGTFIEDPCPACKGAGSITQARQLTVKVPPGIKNGSRIRAKGKGGGRPPGDLYVKIRVRSHPVWRWEGRNLIAKIPVSPIEAMQGGVIRVPVPGGEKKVRIPPSPAQNHRLRLKGIGPGGGDILYQLDIQVPAVPPEAEELLEKLAKILPSGEELRKGLWK